VLATGVPRPGRDEDYLAALARGDYRASQREAEEHYKSFRPAEPAPSASPPVRPESPSQEYEVTWTRFVVQIRAPDSERSIGGEIAQGEYASDGGMVRVRAHREQSHW
jgi:hypothetical protein